MEPPQSNVVDLEGPDDDHLFLDLVADYMLCTERRRAAIRRFAHKLAEMEPACSAAILPFPRPPLSS